MSRIREFSLIRADFFRFFAVFAEFWLMGSEIGKKSMILTEKSLKFSLKSLMYILLCVGPPCISNGI